MGELWGQAGTVATPTLRVKGKGGQGKRRSGPLGNWADRDDMKKCVVRPEAVRTDRFESPKVRRFARLDVSL